MVPYKTYKRFDQKLKCSYMPYMVQKKTTVFCSHYLVININKIIVYHCLIETKTIVLATKEPQKPTKKVFASINKKE